MGTMSIMMVNSAGPAAKQGVSQAAADSTDSNRPDAGNGAVDAVFAILMNQLFGALLQNVQPTASKTDNKPAPVEEASTSMNSVPLPVVQIQAQVPSALQQAAVDSPSIQVAQNQKETADTEKAEQLPEPLKADTYKKENQKLSTLETEGFSPDQDVKAAKPGHSEEIALYCSTKREDNAVLTRDSAAQTGRGKSDEGGEKEGQPALAPAKTDFMALMRAEQPAAQLQATHAAAPRGMDNPQGHAPVGLHGTDPSELFDHTISFVKDGNRLAVQLEPNGLGKLDINLSLDKGVVNAQIHVADDATRNLIENNMQQIVNTLLGEGLSVGGFSVSLKQHGAWDGTTERLHDDTQQKNGLPPGAIGPPGPSAAPRLVNIFI